MFLVMRALRSNIHAVARAEYLKNACGCAFWRGSWAAMEKERSRPRPCIHDEQFGSLAVFVSAVGLRAGGGALPTLRFWAR